MNFKFGEKEDALRDEIRRFVKEELPPGWLAYWILEESSDEDWEFAMSMSKKLSKKGWLTIFWPKEYGGRGASLWEKLVYREEAGYWGIPGAAMGMGAVDWIGPSLMLYGTDDQKKKYLPLIASGDPDGVWCTGYSEPDAGSDFANIRTQAVKEGDKYIINGQKVWISAAHRARWMWLAAVTDPSIEKKHDGISIFIVDMKSKGVTVNPILNYNGYHIFNEVFFDDVSIPKENLVGEENRGWYQLMSALSYERSSMGPWGYGYLKRILDELIVYVKENGLFENPLVRYKLADRIIDVEAMKMLVYQTIWKLSNGDIPVYEAARDKVVMDLTSQRVAITGTEILGTFSQLDPLYKDCKWTKLRGGVGSLYWIFLGMSIGGGTDEIEKNIIGQFGLKLPKSY